MKAICFLITIFFCLNLQAQSTGEFAPLGAKWWYIMGMAFGPPADLILNSEKDTIIGDLTFRKITKTIHEYYFVDEYHYAGYELFYQDSSKIYWLDQFSGELKDYFDYDAEPGDTVKTIALSDDHSLTSEYSQAIVTDVEDTIIEGSVLKMFYLENITPVPEYFTFVYPNKVIEKMGTIGQRFPEFISGVVDIPRAGPILCYEDASGLVKFTEGECEHTVQIVDEKKKTVHIYPNPAHTKIFLQSDEPIYKVILYDIYGNASYPKITSERRGLSISVSDLAEGIYLIHFYTSDGFIGTQKLIKQ